jgi:hypothetical protein
MTKTEEEKKALPDPYRGIHSDELYAGSVGPEVWSHVTPNLAAPEPQKKYTAGSGSNFTNPQKPDFTPYSGNQQASVLGGSNVQGIAGERPQQDLYVRTPAIPPLGGKKKSDQTTAGATPNRLQPFTLAETKSIPDAGATSNETKSKPSPIEPFISMKDGAPLFTQDGSRNVALPSQYRETGLTGQAYDKELDRYNNSRGFKAVPGQEGVRELQQALPRNELMAAANRGDGDGGFVGGVSLDPETAKIAEARRAAGSAAREDYTDYMTEQNMLEGAHGKKQAWLAQQRISAMRAAKSNEIKAKYGIDIDSMMKRSTLDRNQVAMDRDRAEIKKVDAETKNLAEGKKGDWRADQKKLEYALSTRLSDPGLFDEITGLKNTPEYKSADENGRIALRDAMAARLFNGEIGPMAKGGNGTEAQAGTKLAPEKIAHGVKSLREQGYKPEQIRQFFAEKNITISDDDLNRG